MSVIFDEKKEPPEQTSGPDWVDYFVVTSPQIEAGKYILFAYCEIGGTVTNKWIAARGLIDGNEVANINVVPRAASDIYPFPPCGGIQLDAGVHEAKIQYASESSAQTATIRRARLIVMKH